MGLLTLSPLRSRGRRLGIATVALAATLIAASAVAIGTGANSVSEIAVKAAFLYNFAKFAEWPALASAAPIVFCIVGDDRIAAALAEQVRGQNIGGHPLAVSRPQDSAAWRICQMLFLGGIEIRASGEMAATQTLPVLTVSDRAGFAEAGGMIEFYVEAGRMRFVINVDAAGRSKIRLSSRLLGLAKIMREGHAQ